MDRRYTLPIARITEETAEIRTYTFRHNLQAEPGQFIMLTDFNGGEKPFSLSDCQPEEFSITVKRVGAFTSRLFQKRVGDLLSFRGAYGSSFFISKKRVLLVGGGYAVPTFYFLIQRLQAAGAEITLINGARCQQDLLFSQRFAQQGINLHNCTNDGSCGEQATSVELAANLLQKGDFDFVYASGPELMLKALQPHLLEVDYEFLFERYMKCAIGICGNCTMDPLGLRLCVEGPVLPKAKIELLTEFGNYHRQPSGSRVKY
ncbi:MAG: dihydroorotate dehydrogenase electron transfer subunit [Candidatus Cloacimonadales bacterium]